MIKDGRVTVNGNTASLGQSALYGFDDIKVDGVCLKPKEKRVYIMLNKPRGYLTAAKDDRGRKTVMSLVDGAGVRVYPVGRLDMDSEGLLLFTNDGSFAATVAHPSSSKPKVYEVRVRGDVSAALPALRRPMEIDSHTVCAESVEILGKHSGTPGLRMTIVEGRNRQIRKMCSLSGLEVCSLKRVAIGSLELGKLETGKWRHLTEEEVRALIDV